MCKKVTRDPRPDREVQVARIVHSAQCFISMFSALPVREAPFARLVSLSGRHLPGSSEQRTCRGQGGSDPTRKFPARLLEAQNRRPRSPAFRLPRLLCRDEALRESSAQAALSRQRLSRPDNARAMEGSSGLSCSRISYPKHTRSEVRFRSAQFEQALRESNVCRRPNALLIFAPSRDLYDFAISSFVNFAASHYVIGWVEYLGWAG
jgi:hypothetical protein